jgi:hypothetical protein
LERAQVLRRSIGEGCGVICLPGEEAGVGGIGGEFLGAEGAGVGAGAAADQEGNGQEEREVGELHLAGFVGITMEDAPEDGGERQRASDQSFNGTVVGEAAGEQVAATDLRAGPSVGRSERVWGRREEKREFLNRERSGKGTGKDRGLLGWRGWKMEWRSQVLRFQFSKWGHSKGKTKPGVGRVFFWGGGGNGIGGVKSCGWFTSAAYAGCWIYKRMSV